MKIRRALLKTEARHPLAPRSLLSAEQYGDDMNFEAGLLTLRLKEGDAAVTFPAGSLWWMEPAAEKAGKK